MNNKTIVVDISKNGDVSVEGQNFSGPECHNFLKEISDAVGTTTSSTRKKEYNIKTATRHKELN